MTDALHILAIVLLSAIAGGSAGYILGAVQVRLARQRPEPEPDVPPTMSPGDLAWMTQGIRLNPRS